MNGGEAAATAGAAGATGAGLGVLIAETLLSEDSAAAVAIGFALLGAALIALAIRLGQSIEEQRPPTTINVTVTGLDEHPPEVLFEAFQRALRRDGRSL